MNLRLLPIVSLPIVFSLLTVCGLAQKPKGFDVQVNLLVTDEKGEYVDVKTSDVKILDDGVEQKITSMRKVDGLDLCILVDNSGSMARQLEDVARVAKVLVDNLRPSDQATVLRFVSRDKIEITQPWTADKKLLTDTLDHLYIEGGQSAVVDALYLASQNVIERERSAPSRRYAIVLITDTDDP
jgi:VWFA-related protein